LADFSSNESAPANSKTGFYADRDPNKQEVGFIFCIKRLRTLNSYQIFKIKNKKLIHIAVDVLLKGYPMVPLLCRSNLARRYL
jgi:hypothetical protein